MSKKSPETERPFYKDPQFEDWCEQLLIVGLVVGFVGFVLFAKYNKERAHPYIPFTFDVDFLEVTSITSNQSDKAHLRLNLTVSTKLHEEYFNTLQVSVKYDDEFVSNTTIPRFHQDPLSDKTIPLQMDTRVPDKAFVSEGVLNFTVIVHGDYREVNRRGGIGYSCDMNMVCKGVNVTLSSTNNNNTWNGSTSDGPFPCEYSFNGCETPFRRDLNDSNYDEANSLISAV